MDFINSGELARNYGIRVILKGIWDSMRGMINRYHHVDFKELMSATKLREGESSLFEET